MVQSPPVPSEHAEWGAREMRRVLARADASGRVKAKASPHWLAVEKQAREEARRSAKQADKEKAFLKGFKTEELGRMLTEKGEHRLGDKFLRLSGIYTNVWDLANVPRSVAEIDRQVSGVGPRGLKQVAQYLRKFSVSVRWYDGD